MGVVDISFRRTKLGMHDQQELVENVSLLRSWTITLYDLLFGSIVTLYPAVYFLTWMYELLI